MFMGGCMYISVCGVWCMYHMYVLRMSYVHTYYSRVVFRQPGGPRNCPSVSNLTFGGGWWDFDWMRMIGIERRKGREVGSPYSLVPSPYQRGNLVTCTVLLLTSTSLLSTVVHVHREKGGERAEWVRTAKSEQKKPKKKMSQIEKSIKVKMVNTTREE